MFMLLETPQALHDMLQTKRNTPWSSDKLYTWCSKDCTPLVVARGAAEVEQGKQQGIWQSCQHLSQGSCASVPEVLM